VGKSTLLNRLAGREVMHVAAVRAGDGKGRHTTTHRQLVLLSSGALLLDTPGMRELQLWSADAGLHTTFEDVEALAATCAFSDCRHETEPGCAVRSAIEAGELAQEHFANYQKLQRELAFLERKQDARLESEANREIRRIMKHYRRTMKDKE
jgi:ribosome biogenesis GTPase